jgi:hypothetical protein
MKNLIFLTATMHLLFLKSEKDVFNVQGGGHCPHTLSTMVRGHSPPQREGFPIRDM